MGSVFVVISLFPIGAGLALTITTAILNKSNNLGDSKSSLSDFAPGKIHYLAKENNVIRNTKTDMINNPVILEHINEYDKAHGIGKYKS